jgi:menaquinone-dependent protoporphyrinogen oxidase
MARILVIFATTDGHTAKVAQAVGCRLQSRSNHADIVNAATDETDPSAYDAIIVAASVHTGGYQRQIVRWAAKHSATLNQKPTAFVSVCLGILEHKAEVDQRLRAILDAFARSTSWTPGETKIVAGA